LLGGGATVGGLGARGILEGGLLTSRGGVEVAGDKDGWLVGCGCSCGGGGGGGGGDGGSVGLNNWPAVGTTDVLPSCGSGVTI
jgi:hypothetical protein